MAKKSTKPKAKTAPVDPVTDTILVDNPYYSPTSPEEHRKIWATRSLKHDPLARLHHLGHIDGVEYVAGRQWQRYHEESQLSSIGSPDPGREYVDQSYRHRDGVTDKQKRAAKRLADCREALGEHGDNLVRMVLAERLTQEQIADRFGLPYPQWRGYIGKRFKECLGTLAAEFGLTGKSKVA